MIDEYPILSVVASFATGKTEMPGVHELRVKESDRIDAMAKGPARRRVSTVDEGEDWWSCRRSWRRRRAGRLRRLPPYLDHRIAMSFRLPWALRRRKPIHLDDGSPIATSFPVFEPSDGRARCAVGAVEHS